MRECHYVIDAGREQHHQHAKRDQWIGGQELDKRSDQ